MSFGHCQLSSLRVPEHFTRKQGLPSSSYSSLKPTVRAMLIRVLEDCLWTYLSQALEKLLEHKMGVTVEEISVANGLNRMPACQSPGGMWNGDPQSGGTNLVKDACFVNCSENRGRGGRTPCEGSGVGGTPCQPESSGPDREARVGLRFSCPILHP